MKDRRRDKHDDRDARESDEARTRERAREDREIDKAALRGPKSDWQERIEPAAADQGTPEGYEKSGPGEQKSTSRFDLDRGTLEEPEE